MNSLLKTVKSPPGLGIAGAEAQGLVPAQGFSAKNQLHDSKTSAQL
ncbi:MAG: hypothetical protein HQM13_06675 [SAR324 cluster bacterium]|nr:hypothetical protein [SAR324 cluster bacterium]